jgi:hypothetical protein
MVGRKTTAKVTYLVQTPTCVGDVLLSLLDLCIFLSFFLSLQLEISSSFGTPFQTFHHHLIYMMEKLLSRAERRVFNSLASTSAVTDFVKQHLPLPS